MQTHAKKIDLLRRKYNFSEYGLYFVLYKSYFGMRETKNVHYLPEGKRTYLDVIRAKKFDGEKLPLLIYIHGGGWVSGLRKARRYYCRNWAEQGFVCANIGYDYANDAKHPAHIRQIFKGIEYVLDNAERFGIDTSRIVVAGESAGGYFAALVGAVATHRDLYSLFGISFAYQASFHVNACVVISGIYDPARALDTHFPDMDWFAEAFCGITSETLRKKAFDQTQRQFLAPSCYADVHFPPSFIIGSDKDLLLPESAALHAQLDAAGVPNRYFVCTGINGVHAGALACHIGSGKKAVQAAQNFVCQCFEIA